MVTKSIRYLMVLIPLLGAVGCAPHTAGVWTDSDGESRIDNASFNRKVTLDKAKGIFVGDLLQGSAVVSSKIATDQQLQYKFTWFDTNGNSIDYDAKPWKPLKLHGMQVRQIKSVAPNQQAKRFEVYLRPAFSD